MNTLSITVLIVAYNAEKYIAQSIDSVLAQSYRDFELLVLDDGSNDNTREIIRSYEDERIHLVECPHNYIETLNRGINLSKGKYIARMDADDIMHPDRLRIQVSLLEEAPEVTLCATWMQLFDENKGKTSIINKVSGIIDDPIISLLGSNFIGHPTVMIRKEFLCKNSLCYSPNYPYAEDYKLWVDMALAGAVFYIEPEPLLYYRVHSGQVGQMKFDQQSESTIRIQMEIIAHLLSEELYAPLNKVYSEIIGLKLQGLISSQDSLKLMTAFIYKLSNALPK